MHSKNAPTLYDNYLAALKKAALKKDSHLGEHHANMLTYMAETQRYIFDKKASHFLGWMIKNAGSLILEQHEFARPPYNHTWIEIDMPAYLEALDGRDSRSDPDADSRVGYLIMRNHILFFVSETQNSKPLSTPYWYVLHEPISFEAELALAKRLDLSRLTLRECLLGNSGLGKDWFKSEAATNFCRGHTFMLGQSIKDVPGYKLQELLRGAAGSLKQAITILLLLSRPGSGVLSMSNQERRHGIIRGQSRVLAPHHVVTLHLTREAALQRIRNNLHTGMHHRYHSVRGHWAQTRNVRQGCDHDWQPVDPDHYECAVPGCWAKRWWRKNHHRGDKSLGEITKEYGVTK